MRSGGATPPSTAGAARGRSGGAEDAGPPAIAARFLATLGLMARVVKPLAAAPAASLGLSALLGSAGLPVAAGPVAAQTVPRVPVLLVPGWLDEARDLAALRIRFLSAGWAPEAVAAVDFADPTGSNRVHARELNDSARALLARTGAERIDVVAHSMGGLATRTWLREGGAELARRAVFMASPHRGTWSAYLAWGDGSEEMQPGSPFLEWLNSVPAVPGGVEALTIRTVLETHVLPPESATLPGVPDVELCCPTHTGLLRDLDVFLVVQRFLEEGVVLGGAGSPGIQGRAVAAAGSAAEAAASARRGGEVDLLGQLQVLLREAAGVVGGEADGDRVVADVDVRVVVRRVGQGGHPVHEDDGVAEGVEGELLPDQVAVARPAAPAVQPALDGLVVELLGHEIVPSSVRWEIVEWMRYPRTVRDFPPSGGEAVGGVVPRRPGREEGGGPVPGRGLRGLTSPGGSFRIWALPQTGGLRPHRLVA